MRATVTIVGAEFEEILGIDIKKLNGTFNIEALTEDKLGPDSKLAKAGVRPGMKITEVDGVPFSNLSFRQYSILERMTRQR